MLVVLCGTLPAALPWSVALADAPAAVLRSGGQRPTAGAGLQSPEQRSTRFSAYSLPNKVWSLDTGALGVNSSELYGLLGVSRGFKHGFQLDLNLVHWGVGLFGFDVRWSFFERPHFALQVNTGFHYAHGDWIWIVGDVAHDALSNSNMVGFPVGVTATAPLTRWLQVDLVTQYQFAQSWGSFGNGSFYADSQVGARQFYFRPTLRLFASDATAFEFGFKLPAYTEVPVAVDSTVTVAGRTRESSRSSYVSGPFKDTWNMELGARSRLRPRLYATVRLHLGQVSKSIYGAPLYPSFTLEFRL